MQRQKIIVKTSWLGIIVNILLVIFKAIVGLFVNSIAIILDAVNNLTDVVSSVVTIIGTKLANKKPDKEHPFGHGRIEYFASVIISAIILTTGIIAIKESITKIIHPADTDYSLLSLFIVTVAVIVKLVLGRYVKKVGSKVKSESLKASGTDALMDAFLSFTTLVSGIINYIWNINIEGFLATIISLVIIKSALDMLKDSVNIIIGGRTSNELALSLKKDINKYNEVKGVYDLALHNYGPSMMIGSVHIEVKDDMKASEIHLISKKIINDIYEKYNIILTVGIYASSNLGKNKEIKNYLKKIIKDYPYIKQLHGFYVDETNNTVYFDLVFDFKENNSSRIRDEIIEKLEKKYSQYTYNVILDADYSD